MTSNFSIEHVTFYSISCFPMPFLYLLHGNCASVSALGEDGWILVGLAKEA